MYCENCGNKILDGYKFCTKCGYNIANISKEQVKSEKLIIKDEKWWHRLLKVFYLISYLPLFIIIPTVWDSYRPYCSSYTSYCTNSDGESFWYSLLTFVIYIIVLRLIKLAIIYIVYGRKPEWKKEFKKLY